MRQSLIILLASCLVSANALGTEEEGFTLPLTVITSSGEPVAGARFAIFDPQYGLETASFDKMLADQRTGKDGSVELIFDKSLAKPTLRIMQVSSDSTGTMLLMFFGEGLKTLTMPEASIKRGLVLDASGKPVEGVSVTPILTMQEMGNPICGHLSQVLTDQKGRFEINDFPENGTGYGLYFFKEDTGIACWTAPGRRMPSEFSNPDAPEPASQNKAPGEDGDLTVLLKVGASISGKVVDFATKEGIPGLPVTLALNRSGILFPSHRTTTGPDGSYRITNTLIPGDCTILAEQAGRFSDCISVLAGESGSSTNLPSIEVFPPCVIRGQVLDEATGAPMPEREVTLHIRREDRNPTNNTCTMKEGGKFELRDGPGLVTLVAQGINCDIAEKSQEHRLILDHQFPIEGVTIFTSAWEALTGCVLLPDGNPAQGADVSVSYDRDRKLDCVTNEKGIFQAPLPKSSLYQSKYSHDYLQCLARLEGDIPMLGVSYLLPQPDTLVKCEIQLYETASITGTVVDETGQARVGVTVRCGIDIIIDRQHRHWHNFTKGRTDEEGNYVLSDCPVGLELTLKNYSGTVDTGRISPIKIILKSGESNTAPPLKWKNTPKLKH